MKKSGIYKITNTITGDFYIGSSKDIKRRWAEHKRPSSLKKQPNNPLYKDFQKYGLDKFSFQILEEVEVEQLKEKEQHFIELLKPIYNNINAKGLDVKRYKENIKEYQKSNKYKEHKIEYYQQNRDRYKEYYNKYKNQLCSYNGETMTLNALSIRFTRAGIEHPTLEAKKYLLKNNNPIEFYDIYP